MLDINDLEKRWYTYNLKKKIPYVIGSSILLLSTISVIAYLTLYKNPSSTLSTNSEKKKIIEEKPSEIKPTALLTQEPLKKDTEYKPTILKPSLSFATRVNEYKNAPLYIPSAPTKEKTSTPLAKEPIKKITPVKEQKVPEPIINEEVVVKEVTQEPIHKNSLKLSMRDNEKDLQDVINRFKKNKNPKLSLHIAKKYYSLRRYNKSYNYALITNQIDENIEDSWVIFAKSLYKLGEKKMAMKTLNSYIKSSESIKASILLSDMQKGNFK